MTDYQKWLTRKFYIYKLLTNLWFLSAIWLYFYRLFITDQQVGILDGAAFAIGLIAEVPSGVLADKFGRSRLVKVGQILAGSGLLIQGFGSSFIPFFIGQSILMIGISFISGADEALFYAKFNFKENSLHWRKIITRTSQLALISTTLATVIGGLLYNVNPRIPWILTGLSFIASVLAIWSIKESRLPNSNKRLLYELQDNFKGIKSGFIEFFQPKLILYVPIIIIVQGLFYTSGWGILRLILLSRFGFSPFMGSAAIAVSSLFTVGLLHLMHMYADKMNEKYLISSISLVAGISLLVSVPDIGTWGFFIILALYSGEHILYPFMSEVLNKRAEERQRATVISVASFLRTLPYAALAPLIGYLNTYNRLEYFLIGWAVLIFLSLVIYMLFKRKEKTVKVSFTEEMVLEKRTPDIFTKEE